MPKALFMPAPEDAGAIRAALVDHVARVLGPIPEAPGRAELAALLQPLTATRIIGCLGPTPRDTAELLVSALGYVSASETPDEAIADLVASEFPHLRETERTLLIRFTRVVRRIAAEHDGAVTSAQLYAERFSSREAGRLMPDASHILAVLAGSIAPRGGTEPALPPVLALRALGARTARPPATV